MNLQGQQVSVVGMAASGIATALFLRQHGARVVVSELRSAEQLRAEIPRLLAAGVAIETGGHRERTFLTADLIVVSPGVPSDLPVLARARREGIPIIGEIELAARFLRAPLIAITGSNGKTTTTALAGHLLAALGLPAQVGGNIGTPLISLVEAAGPGEWAVAEVSSFQLETAGQFHARIACVLNLSPDHLDRHGSMENYAAAKQKVFLNQTPADFAVLNAGDEWCRRFAAALAAPGGPNIRWFAPSGGLPSGGAGAFVAGGRILWRQEGAADVELLPISAIPLRGAHNVENVLAACAIAVLAAGMAAPEAPAQSAQLRARLAHGVATFKAVEHRLEFVAKLAGVDYFNDSKATNVDATLKAVESFPGGLWVILGGKDKGGDYDALLAPLQQRARGVLVIGAAASKIARQLAPLGGGLIPAGTLERALEIAAARATAGDTVLLAPACSSFDQFENYQHRGRVFKEWVGRRATQGAPENRESSPAPQEGPGVARSEPGEAGGPGSPGRGGAPWGGGSEGREEYTEVPDPARAAENKARRRSSPRQPE